MTKSVYNILFLLLIAGPLYANKPYWIYFHTKSNHTASGCWVSDVTIKQRIATGLPEQQLTDLPVDEPNIQILENIGVCINQKSKWLNAVHAYLDETQFEKIKKLKVVKHVEKAGELIVLNSFSADDVPKKSGKLYDALAQIKANALISSHHTGAGVRIGVVDAGFKNLDTDPTLTHLIRNNKIKAFRDYHNPNNKNPFDAKASGMGNHGASVLKYIGGKDQFRQYGLATSADYYLAFTDHDKFEKRIEESYWVAAMEWLDSLGVKLVNSSLGYADGYDDPNENYSPTDIDGSSAISRAAQIAATEKGMLIVVSAGNDGLSPFQVISLPADAKDVLSVGAVEFKNMFKMGYSSTGPETLAYTKPDVSCYSVRGTSYSAPIITGLAACIMQANPKLTNLEVIDIIKQSSSIYPFANNFIGYGVPDAEKIMRIIAGKEIETCKEIKYSELSSNNIYLDLERIVTIFHKSDKHHVATQIRAKIKGHVSPLQLNPNKTNIQQSTIASWKYCYEILWNE
jgi:hypothetical protein